MKNTVTVRGDKEQRRRDVLAAAAALLEESGWDDFSIRDIAARAGVSGGAVYQWFSGKGEIWAHLQAARFAADTQTVEQWPDDLAPVEAVHRIVSLIAQNHTDVGRHRFAFDQLLDGRVPEYLIELTSARHLLNAAIAERLNSINGDEGEPDNQLARLAWLWATARGVGDHLVDSRFEAVGVERDDFLDTTAECVLAGLRAPSPVAVDLSARKAIR